jgi:hypothetical protein
MKRCPICGRVSMLCSDCAKWSQRNQAFVSFLFDWSRAQQFGLYIRLRVVS